MKQIKLWIAFLMLVMLAGIASAATLNAPTSGAVVESSTYVLNITTGADYVTECNFSFSASNTANSTAWVVQLTNDSSNATYLNKTWDSSKVQDSSSWTTGTVRCYNNRSNEPIANITAVTFIVDHTTPSGTSYTRPSNSTAPVENGDTITVTLASGTMTACYVDLWKGKAKLGRYSGTVNNTAKTLCTYAIPSSTYKKFDNDWSYQAVFTDGRNQSTAPKTNMDVQRTGVVSGGGAAIAVAQAQGVSVSSDESGQVVVSDKGLFARFIDWLKSLFQ